MLSVVRGGWTNAARERLLNGELQNFWAGG